ncbi:hypothetical protein BT69DRAFT_220993 [Atractiella rhizophila]|nr:hypothetical protein BT69DRAFT_220993 [Atractiella rhizophila]
MSYPPPSGPPPPTSPSAPSNSNSPRSPSDREESPAAHFVPDRQRQPYTTVSSTAHGIPEDVGMASADQGERSVPEREMWFCHECHRSSQPLMQPDPHCAYCGGTFMERMDDPSNDPRDFDPDPPEDDNGPHFATPPPFFFQGGRGGQEGGGDFGQGIFGSLFRLLAGPRPSAEEGATGQPGWQTNESTGNFGPFGLRTTTTTFRNPNRPGEGLQATFYFGNSGNAAGSPPQTTVDRGPTPTPPPQGYSPPDGPPPQPGQAQQVPIQNLAQYVTDLVQAFV